MVDIAGIMFVYHMTKSFQSFIDKISYFIWYSKVTYITNFIAIYSRNFHYCPEGIILKYIHSTEGWRS